MPRMFFALSLLSLTAMIVLFYSTRSKNKLFFKKILARFCFKHMLDYCKLKTSSLMNKRGFARVLDKF